MNKKIAPVFENVAEAGVACLVTMVQGNLLLVGVTHWITATQTGLIAGVAATVAFAFAKTENRLVLAGILGVLTGVVDYFVHPGMIGESRITEAVITGLGAAVLSYVVSTIIMRFRQRGSQ